MSDVLEQLMEHASEQGELDRAIEAARRLLSMDGLQEHVHRALMRLHALQGHREAALQQFRHCRELLDRELGVEPEPETIALADAIGRGVLQTGDGVPSAPPLKKLKQGEAASFETTRTPGSDMSSATLRPSRAPSMMAAEI